MTAGEGSLHSYVRNGLSLLRSKCHVTKHNDLTPGIPDLSICTPNGHNTWMELKATKDWPARAETKLWWDHYTEHQALFLRQRHGWLFVRVARNYFLFDGERAWDLWTVGGYTRAEMFAHALKVWPASVDWEELVEIIS